MSKDRAIFKNKNKTKTFDEDAERVALRGKGEEGGRGGC